MLQRPLTVLLARRASNELGTKDLLEVLSRAMLGRDLVEADQTNEPKKHVLFV
jgi:hypothetical protein